MLKHLPANERLKGKVHYDDAISLDVIGKRVYAYSK
jgi:hypothetical protein